MASTALTLADASRAVEHAVAMALAQDAAATAVDPSLVVKTSRAFKCAELADKLEAGVAARQKLTDAAEAAAAVLKPTKGLLEALQAPGALPPETTAKAITFATGRQFKTTRAEKFATLWHLLHPEASLIVAFYDALREHADVSLSTETVYIVSSRVLNAKSLAASAKELVRRLKSV